MEGEERETHSVGLTSQFKILKPIYFQSLVNIVLHLFQLTMTLTLSSMFLVWTISFVLTYLQIREMFYPCFMTAKMVIRTYIIQNLVSVHLRL